MRETDRRGDMQTGKSDTHTYKDRDRDRQGRQKKKNQSVVERES